MRAAIIAVTLAVLLAGGGVAFYVSPVIAASSADAEAVKAEESGGLLGPSGPAFVQIPILRVPVVHQQRTVQFLEIDMMVEVEDESMAAEYEANMMYLQDQVIESLYGQFDRTMGANGSSIETLRLKRKVAAAVAEVMGRETVKDILIQNIRQRRI